MTKLERLKSLVTKKRTIAAVITAGLLWAGWEYPKIMTLLAILGLPGVSAA